MLEGAGIPPARVSEVRGYADTRPRVPEDPLAPENRRISVLLPFSQLRTANDSGTTHTS